MKAIICTKYGPPEVLQLAEVEKPAPNDNEILVKIYASSVNPHDWRTMRADPFLVRLMGGGFLKPKHEILGVDIAGRVEAVIPNFQIHEHHIINLKQGNRELCVQDYQPENGRFSIPDLPGLGIELNDVVLEKSPCVIVK